MEENSTVSPPCSQTPTLNISPEDHNLHFIFYCCFTTSGILLNLLLLLCLANVIVKYRKATDTTVYYLIIVHSSTALVYLSCNVFVMLPCMKDCSFYSPGLLKVLTGINTVGYYSELAAICLMTLERVLVFFTPEIHKEAGKKKLLALAFPWIFGFFMVGLNAIGGCYKK